MKEDQQKPAPSLKVMMLVLLSAMAAAAGIAYLLVYPYFHQRPH